MEKWIPFALVNLVLVILLFFSGEYLPVLLICLVLFNLIYFPFQARLRNNLSKFILSKKGLSLFFENVVEKVEKQMEEIEFKKERVKVDGDLIRKELTKAENIIDLFPIVSDITLRYTLEAVHNKQRRKGSFEFNTKKISPNLDQIFSEK
jgi:hypothetical protein